MSPCTYVLVVVDESTSMLGVARGVRIGVNAYLADLAQEQGLQHLVTLVTFSEERRVVCQITPAGQVPRLDQVSYRPRGNTALLDAVADTLDEFAQAVTLQAGDRVLFLLATDGAENWSTRHSPGDVLEKVMGRELDGQWTFIHMAAGQEAAEQSLCLGLRNVIAIAQEDLAREALFYSMAGATALWSRGGEATGMVEHLHRELHETAPVVQR
ncbi:MAG: hypothetical protein ABWY93_22705 [Mycobacterium sp.]